MSQTDMAAKLGVTFQQIQKYEKGTNRVGAGRLLIISELLNVSVPPCSVLRCVCVRKHPNRRSRTLHRSRIVPA
jgi:transcriptional regulator with XRE-family HTH domain